MRVVAVQFNPTVGDLEGNGKKMIAAIQRAREGDVVVFPELAVCGYCPEDLLLDSAFIQAMGKKAEEVGKASRGKMVVFGLARVNGAQKEKPLFNSAAVFVDGKCVGYKDKTLLPTYDVFDERRYFEPALEQPIFVYQGKRIAVTICEDVWQHATEVGYTHYLHDPIAELKKKKPDLVLNLSGSPYAYGRAHVRMKVFQKAAQDLQCPVVFCNQVGANDQLIFDGHSFYVDEKGCCIAAPGFVEHDLIIEKIQCKAPKYHDLDDLYQALVLGVRDYFHKQGFSKAILGLSGGIDSALVACIAKEALGASNVLAVLLPSRFSSEGSIQDSIDLAKKLGIAIEQISIEPLFEKYLTVLEPKFHKKPQDQTEENLQTRIRGMILMAFSNKLGHILLNTSNKSELAMGYCTLYGDMAGGLGVLLDVTKTKVYQLAKHIGLPEKIIKKVPSAELKENQTDFDVLPPFEILDAVIEDYIEERRDLEWIAKKRGLELSFVREIVHKMHLAEYKRRQAPIGLRVTAKAFSKGRVVPIVQKWR